MEYIRPFVRPVLLISTILGVLLLPVNWSDLPSSHPNTLGRLPESMFTVPTLFSVVFFVFYVAAEGRNIRRWYRFRWLQPNDAVRYYRELLAGAEDDLLVAMLDRGGDWDFARLAMGQLIHGVNQGKISLRGRLENGAAIKQIPVPLERHAFSRIQKRHPNEAQIGADGCIYVDLEFLKLDVKRFAQSVRRDGRNLTKLSTENQSPHSSDDIES